MHAYSSYAFKFWLIQAPILPKKVKLHHGKLILTVYDTNLWFEYDRCTYSSKYIHKQVWIGDLYMSSVIVNTWMLLQIETIIIIIYYSYNIRAS